MNRTHLNMNANLPNLGSFDRRFGADHMTSSQHTSSFLFHTPPEALHSTVSAPARMARRRFQTPSILPRKWLNKARTTTMPTITTTPMRGDQRPPIDDDNQDDIDHNKMDFVPLSIPNQPITVPPIYFYNDRDKSEPCIAHIFTVIFYHFFFCSMFFLFMNFPTFSLYFETCLPLIIRANSSTRTWKIIHYFQPFFYVHIK